MVDEALKANIVPGNANREEALTAVGQAQRDAEQALKLMDAREQEFEQRRQDRERKRGVYWVKGITAQQVDGAELDELQTLRGQALALRDKLDLLRAALGNTALPTQPKQ